VSRLELTLALGDYDHTRDLAAGVVRADGIDITHLKLGIEETFFRFLKFREFDVSELSFAKYVSMIAQGDAFFVGIPVFPSRVFRLSSFYVRADGRVRSPADLAGARIGIPEWGQTASVYTRGYIQHELGIPLARIEWVQAGVNEPGRVEKVKLDLPAGVRYTSVADASLDQMLIDGRIDVALSARAPRSFAAGDARIRRLFPDFQAREEAHFAKTGIFPIMHVIAIRKDVYEASPWVAMNLLKAFDEAKARSAARMADMTASHAPLPWLADFAARMRSQLGADPFPYGIEPNRRTLEAFLRYAREQGLCAKPLAPEDLFVREVRGEAFRI
jgi:4,5-dihydroxyphthalate decarboxylase